MKDSDKKIDFIFGENSNYYQIGNAYLQFQSTLRVNGGHVDDDDIDVIRLVNNASVHLFEKATISTTGGSENEMNKHVGPISTIMKNFNKKRWRF